MKQVLIDTNIILRLLLADVPRQTKKAREIFDSIEEEKQSGLISILVINELIWILEHFYKQKRRNFIPLILELLSLKKIKILEIKKTWLVKILRKMEEISLDFTDLYLAFCQQKEKVGLETFDKRLRSFTGRF